MMKIVLVEDCAVQRKFYSLYLEDSGHQVMTAKDGVEALELIETSGSSWEVLISDYNMPFMNGVELIERLLPQKKFNRLILFSGALMTSIDFGCLDENMHSKNMVYYVNKDTEGIAKLSSLLSDTALTQG
jgi:CheY-like chemotaxis protein